MQTASPNDPLARALDDSLAVKIGSTYMVAESRQIGIQRLRHTATKQQPHETYRDIVHQVHADGCSLSYRHNEIDLEVASESTCEECGATGLDYEAWRNDNPRVYYAVAVCRSCGYAFLF